MNHRKPRLSLSSCLLMTSLGLIGVVTSASANDASGDDLYRLSEDAWHAGALPRSAADGVVAPAAVAAPTAYLNGCPKGVKITVYPGDSIQAAVDSASPGDSIHVQPGVYYESVDVATPCLTFKGGYSGGQGDWAVLDGTGAGVNGFTIRADDITIDGFEIRNFLLGGNEEGSGIAAACAGSDAGCGLRANHGTLRNNFIHNNYYSGIYVGVAEAPAVSGWRVLDNEVVASAGESFGVLLLSCSDCRVAGNQVSATAPAGRGIQIEAHNDFGGPMAVSDVRVEGNTVTGPFLHGIRCNSLAHNFAGNSSQLSDVRFEDNYVEGVRQLGLAAWAGFAADTNMTAEHIRVESNVVVGSGLHNIYYQKVTDGVIEGNKASSAAAANIVLTVNADRNRVESNMTVGSGARSIVLVNNSADNVVEGNTVRNSGLSGIFLFRGASNNVVKENRVLKAGQHGIQSFSQCCTNTGNQFLDNTINNSASGCDSWWDELGDNCWEGNTGSQCPDPLPTCD